MRGATLLINWLNIVWLPFVLRQPLAPLRGMSKISAAEGKAKDVRRTERGRLIEINNMPLCISLLIIECDAEIVEVV